MIIEMPFTSEGAQTMTVQLQDAKYDFEVKYNERSKIWIMDIYDSVTKQPIVQSVPLVIDEELLDPYNFHMGRMLVVDTSNMSKDAGPDDLGTRVKVYWFSDDEVIL